MTRFGTALPVAVTAALLLLPLAILAWLRQGTPSSIDAIETGAEPLLVAPTERTVTDEQRVFAQVTFAEGLPLRAPAWKGIVGRRDERETVTSGDVVALVDGISRVALATPEPFYRPLGPGDAGPDVARLNSALAALGYLAADAAGTDRYLSATVRAVREWATNLGVPTPDGSFDPAWVVWLPQDPFRAGQWQLDPGAPAPSAGAIIATGPRTVSSAVLASQNPAEPLALDPRLSWVFVAEGVTIPLDAAARLAPAEAAKLTPLVPDGQDRVDGVVRRAQPLKALAVPSTAIQAGASGQLCAWLAEAGAYRAVPVELGRSIGGVTEVLAGLTPAARVLANPAAVLPDTSCPSN